MTSVWQPLGRLGGDAVDVLVDLINGTTPSAPALRVPMRLDLRRSTGIAPGGETSARSRQV
jgi:DNA-binding LacI/PurR family transcriptional regulator